MRQYFLKNFDKLLTQNVLNNKQFNFIVKWKYSLFNPVSYYLNAPALVSDPFRLALISYHLLKVKERETKVLDQVNDKVQASKSDKAWTSFQSRLGSDIETLNISINTHSAELNSVLRANVTNISIEAAIKALYVLSNTAESYPRDTLIDIIKSKLKYASADNLHVLLQTLNKQKSYDNSELWKALLDKVQEKAEEPAYQTVLHTGWETNKYETGNEKKCEWKSPNEYYFEDLKKRGKLISDVLCGVRSLWMFEKYRFGARMFRETRLHYTPVPHDEVTNEQLIAQLEEAKQGGLQENETLENIIHNLKTK
jgi:hypothetical protein